MFVKIGVVAEAGKKSEPVQEYAFNGGVVTIEVALKSVGVTFGAKQDLRLERNSEIIVASLGTELQNGDKLVVIPKVKGA